MSKSQMCRNKKSVSADDRVVLDLYKNTRQEKQQQKCESKSRHQMFYDIPQYLPRFPSAGPPILSSYLVDSSPTENSS